MLRDGRRIIVALAASAGLCFAALAVALFLSRGADAEPAAEAPRKVETRSAPAAESPAPVPPSSSEPAVVRRPTLTVGPSAYGPILFDRRGFALYAFTRDSRGRSVCRGACAAAWPPYILRGELQAGPKTRRSLLATTRRSDGRLQVTYGGRPLYYYVGDTEPGLVLCQDVVEFGGTWLVLRASGSLVR